MYPLYSQEENDFELYRRKARHVGPHLHPSLELVLVTEGSIALGIGSSLYALNEGDAGIVFPNQVHHYQAFGETPGRVTYLLAAPSLAGAFIGTLESHVPENPVIPKAKLHPDVLYALQTLTGRRKKGNYDDVLRAAYIHILLSRILPELTLKERVAQPTDLVDAVVTYIAAHSREEISLTSVAKALYISPYTLSRMFSSTFHTNFNRYVNHSRLEYSRMLLEETKQPVTEICLDAGFGSQRTFNRAFQTEFHMTPAQYRKQHREGKSS